MGDLIRLKLTAPVCYLLVFGFTLTFYHCVLLKDTGSENVSSKVYQLETVKSGLVLLLERIK